MRVLLVSPKPPPCGGIAQWSQTVSEYLEHQSDIQLIHINTGNGTKDVVNRGFFNRFIRSFLRIFKLKRQIREAVRKAGCDVAHLTTSAGFGLIRDIMLLNELNRMKIKTAYHLHFGRFEDINKRNTIEYKIIKIALKRADCIVAMDPGTYNCLKKDYQTFLVPNPIEAIPYHYSATSTAVFIGYVVKNKGIEELLAAWDIIVSSFADWKLRIVGQYTDDYLKQIKGQYTCRNIEFLGEMCHDDAMKELADASILVLPSYSEGFPYVICEAMYCGKAIIGSNVGSIPFLLEGECGILCEPNDLQSLLSSIEKLIGDEKLRATMAANASKKARSMLSVNTVMEKYLKIWNKLLHENRISK